MRQGGLEWRGVIGSGRTVGRAANCWLGSLQARSMALSSIKDAPAKIPEGYVAIPASAQQVGAALRVCVIAKLQPDPVAGHLVLVRDLLDAQVYLGCVTDSAGRVHEWVEIWVQNVGGLHGSLAESRESTSNAVLDKRWVAHFDGFERLDAGTILRTGWEQVHPRPTFLDLANALPVHPVDAGSGEPWELCQDDAILLQKKLPAYSTSLFRYLYVKKLGAGSNFIAVDPLAPVNESVKPITELTGGKKEIVPLNPGGGLMMVRAYSPIGFETYIDLVGGASSEGVVHGKTILHLQAGAPTSSNGEGALTSEGWLYLGKHGRSGRLLETLHLKLKALADAVEQVRAVVREHQTPMLNLSPDSFQVRAATGGSGLPALWTAKVLLVDPGDALELRIANSDARYFVPGRASGTSIYRPTIAAQPISGRCTLRIRQVLPDVGGATVLEGTFVTQERLDATRNDLVWMRIPLGAGPVNLYARMEAQTAMASGEYRFRTIAQGFSPEVTNQLKAAAGVPIGNTSFEMLPLLSTPVDLYALGVMAVRTLLVNPATTLPVALDEMLSLARQLATEYDPAIGLGLRIRSLFERDPRWIASLGPQHLVHEEVTPEDAFDLVPQEVWWDALSAIVRMFPGMGPDSIVQDFGDAPAGAAHKMFDRAAGDLNALLVRTRSLIVIDWRANREIHAVIRGYLTGLAEGPVR